MSDIKPLLSICIPTYNRAEYLIECTDALMNSLRGYENLIEVIISDNASTDNTKEIVKKIRAKYDLIQYYRNEKNLIDENYWIVSKLSKGEYVWILGDNRFVFEYSIKILISFLVKNYSFIILNYALYSLNEGKFIREKYYEIDDDKEFHNHDDLLNYFGFELGHVSQIIFKKEILKKVNYIDFVALIGTGWPFFYLICNGIFKNTRAILLKDNMYIKKVDTLQILSQYQEGWEEHFVTGSSKFIKKLQIIGYSKNTISILENNLIKGAIFSHIIMDKKNKSVSFSRYGLIVKHYYKNKNLWIYLFPLICLPSFIIPMLSRLKKLKTKW